MEEEEKKDKKVANEWCLVMVEEGWGRSQSRDGVVGVSPIDT